VSAGPVELLDLDLLEELPPSLRSDLPGGIAVVLHVGELVVGQFEVAAPLLPVEGPQLKALIADAATAAVGQHLLGSWFDGWLPELRPSRPRAQAPRASEVTRVTRPLATLGRRSSTSVKPSLSVSVVVCTRHRPDRLRRCLAALAHLDPAPGEVVVVDNTDGDPATRAAVEERGPFRYLVEPKPGLSAARNAGIAATSGDVIAFTDDDVLPRQAWLMGLLQPFAEGRVGAVTGLVLPAALSTEAELLFERDFGGFGGGFLRRRFDRRFLRGMRWHTPPVWKIGAGANMAVRRRALDIVGVFDERLGAGAAGCSEDSELWYRLIEAGFECVYEPSAVVVHHHREDLTGIRQQLRDYMRGHVTALGVQFDRHRQPGELRRLVANLPAHYAKRAVVSRLRAEPDPTLRAEATGYLHGIQQLARTLRLPSGVGPGRRSGRAFLAKNPFPHPRTEGFYFREKMRAIHRVAPHDDVRTALEVGGGGSGLTRALFPKAHVVSMDLETDSRWLQPNGPSGFVAADARRLPFGDQVFDCVTFFDVLEHVEEDGLAVQEAMRVLRPGGSLLVTAPNASWRFPFHSRLRAVCPTDTEVMAEWGHVRRGYADEDLERLVGLPAVDRATFLNPVTVISHDLGFSHLPGRVRRTLIAALKPVVLPAYLVHRPHWRGTETAWWWRKPLGPD